MANLPPIARLHASNLARESLKRTAGDVLEQIIQPIDWLLFGLRSVIYFRSLQPYATGFSLSKRQDSLEALTATITPIVRHGHVYASDSADNLKMGIDSVISQCERGIPGVIEFQPAIVLVAVMN